MSIMGAMAKNQIPTMHLGVFFFHCLFMVMVLVEHVPDAVELVF